MENGTVETYSPKEMGRVLHHFQGGTPQRTDPQKHIFALYSGSAECYETL